MADQSTYALIASWQALAEDAKRMAEREREMRRHISTAVFGNKINLEGTHKHTLPNGEIVKMVVRVNRAVDENKLRDVSDEAIAEIDFDNLFYVKHTLNVKAYAELSSDQLELIDGIVNEKPGLPALEVV